MYFLLRTRMSYIAVNDVKSSKSAVPTHYDV